jgi:hypothetical protein
MIELVRIGATSVDGSRPRFAHPSKAVLLHGEADAEPTATSLTAALAKKHTFGCAQPTRGAVCDC